LNLAQAMAFERLTIAFERLTMSGHAPLCLPPASA
jgi:hypothetical protein